MTYLSSGTAVQHIQRLTRRATILSGDFVHLPARATVQQQGMPSCSPCELILGTVVLIRNSPKRGPAIVDIAGPGSIIGEISLADADCKTIAATDILLRPLDGLDAEVVADIVDAERTRQCERSRRLAKASALERVACFLLALAAPPCRRGLDCGGCVLAEQEITIPVTRREIAAVLSLTEETVSRSFSKLQQEGLIRVSKLTKVAVTNPAGLVAYGGGGAACKNANTILETEHG